MGQHDIAEMSKALAQALTELPLQERIEALNQVRTALHEVSPFRGEPVDLVIWRPAHDVRANDYNPNSVAPPEMRLLAVSVQENGYTQPIVVHDGVVVDGFHRNRVGREIPAVRDRVHGYLPTTQIRADRSDLAARMAATVQHNRARGEHGVERMADLVRQMIQAGWNDKQIQRELGMEPDEVLRLKQLTGLAALFADREFSEAWEVDL